MEDLHVDRSIGGKKPKSTGKEEPSMVELSGFNSKRQEFDPEYDNEAEQSLAEMDFKDTDTEAERELKLRILCIYLNRLDERKRRKDFILERDLLYPDPFVKELSPEEREIYQRYKVFMRFHSKEDHEELIRTVIEEYRVRKKIHDLQVIKYPQDCLERLCKYLCSGCSRSSNISKKYSKWNISISSSFKTFRSTTFWEYDLALNDVFYQ